MFDKIKLFQKNLNTVIIGKEKIIEKITACIIAGGNLLLEDMPGVGKTILSKSISLLISQENGDKIKFSRIQGTPDLLPYDITGVDIYDPHDNKFKFHPGPVFTDILLADELNRATPKVQSALLEAMAEKQVTSGGNTYKLSDSFLLIATQNPIETDGTYPLPAAQLDRFTCLLKIGYPDQDSENEILKQGKSENKLHDLKPVISKNEIMEIKKITEQIEFSETLRKVITATAARTRATKELKSGLSTRALLSMLDISKAYAYLNDRKFVSDQDIIELAVVVWAHRLVPSNPQIRKEEIIDKIVREEVRRSLV